MCETDVQPDHYRWPAEWEPHAAVWLAWPVNKATWPGIFDRIPAAFANIVAAIAQFEPVNILLSGHGPLEVAHRLIQNACERAAATFDVHFVDLAVNDSWCRDYGPIFLNRRQEFDSGPDQIIIAWDYNAWGGKYPPWDDDARVAGGIAELLNLPAVKPDIILEGGAVEGNGAGTILTTESCLRNPNRQTPGHRQTSAVQSDPERFLARYMAAEKVVWLPGTGLCGDDTDGHIDQLARFADERTVLIATPFDEDAPEAAQLRANYDAVVGARNSRGDALVPVSLPLPAPKFCQGHRLPASYCNFYIANNGIVVPTFGDNADDAALSVVQAAFPGHRVVGVSAIELVWGLGAFHCLTQQQPLPC